MFFLLTNHNLSSKSIKYSHFCLKIAIFDQFVESIALSFIVANFSLKNSYFFDVIIDSIIMVAVAFTITILE